MGRRSGGQKSEGDGSEGRAGKGKGDKKGRKKRGKGGVDKEDQDEPIRLAVCQAWGGSYVEGQAAAGVIEGLYQLRVLCQVRGIGSVGVIG